MRFEANRQLCLLLETAEFEDLTPLYLQLELVPRRDFLKPTLVKRVVDVGGNSLTNIFRTGEAASYLSMVRTIADAAGVEYDKDDLERVQLLDDTSVPTRPSIHRSISDEVQIVVYDLEEQILQRVLLNLHKSLTKVQKIEAERFFKELSSNHGIKNSKALLGTGGLILTGELGGFGTYMALSSTLHAISLGTLGFGAYTTASSILSVILGPIGWTALGIWALFKIGSPKVKKILPLVTIIAVVRRKNQIT